MNVLLSISLVFEGFDRWLFGVWRSWTLSLEVMIFGFWWSPVVGSPISQRFSLQPGGAADEDRWRQWRTLPSPGPPSIAAHCGPLRQQISMGAKSALGSSYLFFIFVCDYSYFEFLLFRNVFPPDVSFLFESVSRSCMYDQHISGV